MTPEQKRKLLVLQQQQAQASAPAAEKPSLDDRISGAIRPVQEWMSNFQNRMVEGATLGLIGDEARAAVGSTFSPKTYDEALTDERSREAGFREDHPVAAGVADVASVAVPGAGVGKLLGGASLASKAVTGAVTGAAAGGIYGAAEGEGRDDRLRDAGNGALFGAALGAAASTLVAGVPRAVSATFRRSVERPSIDALRNAKTAAYRAVDRSGEAFSGDDMQALFQRVSDDFNGNNYVEEVDNASRAVLTLLERRQGKETTLTQLDGIRQNLWKRYSGAKDQPQILDAIRAIDELVESRAGASDLMSVARAANARYAKSELLDNAFRKAADQTASTGSGGNILNKYRQAVTSIINDPRKARFFTSDEIDLMRNFVRGDLTENALRKIGKLSPDGNGLMLALHSVGGYVSGGATLPLMVGGGVAKSAADGRAQRGANAILDNLAGVPTRRPPQVNALSGAAASATAPLSNDAANSLQYRESPTPLSTPRR